MNLSNLVFLEPQATQVSPELRAKCNWKTMRTPLLSSWWSSVFVSCVDKGIWPAVDRKEKFHRDCCKGHGNHDVGRKRNLEEHPNLPVGFRLDPKTNRTFELGRINPIESAGFRLETTVTADIPTAFRFGYFDSFLCSYESLCVIRASGELGKSKLTFHRDNYTSWSLQGQSQSSMDILETIPAT
ncbi:hypothetical protein L2E82_17320 [Cichorium intybus]|uniref:Uncharacterized protein n=1 Tax=Cichorium intybus TaxID=13427 RepID=A0ACB9F987_CICIN|nr:hypothetical protein L2E82_17320 [Cichorium intybus]